MHCRASWGNSFAWAAVIAFGILGAAIAEGANASPNRRSRSADPSIAHPNPLNSLLKEDIGDLSQCTNYDYPGKAAPAELEVHTVFGAPKHPRSLESPHNLQSVCHVIHTDRRRKSQKTTDRYWCTVPQAQFCAATYDTTQIIPRGEKSTKRCIEQLHQSQVFALRQK